MTEETQTPETQATEAQQAPADPNAFNLTISVEELRKKKLFVATPMYGGMCAGMFTRAIADLSALCHAYGIPLQLYFLFNESLITRARNYCCDEFMRSGATHLMFIDYSRVFGQSMYVTIDRTECLIPEGLHRTRPI